MKIHCKYCNQEFRSMTDLHHHICMAVKTKWDNPKKIDKELNFLKSSIKINRR
jgi:hypothetical protein